MNFGRGKCALLMAVLAVVGAVAADAQQGDAKSEAINWDALNMQGSNTALPSMHDNLIPSTTKFRTAMARHGWTLRVNATDYYYKDVLADTIDKKDQVYVGQRGTWRWMFNGIVTYDMRAFGLKDAQFFASGGSNHVSWEANGPNATTMSSMTLYKGFANKRIEVKGGYVNNDWEFVTIAVGGSVSSGKMGVYAVLPYELGLTHFPTTAPGLNVRLQLPQHIYAKVGAQRSVDSGGGHVTITRNPLGFRFIPKGDKLLMIYEGGYRTASTETASSTWLRAGVMRNTTPYNNFKTGTKTSGNSGVYMLLDHQLTHAGYGGAGNGLYAGASIMAVSQQMNIYSRYYELRLYDKGPWHARPHDMAALLATYTGFSPDYTAKMAALGKSYWRGSTTITGSYSYVPFSGMYVGLGLTFGTAPAPTPKLKSALTPNVQLNYYF